MIWHLCLFHPICAAILCCRLSADVHPMQGGGISCGGTSHGRGTPSGATRSTQAATLQRWLLHAPQPLSDDRQNWSAGEPMARAPPRKQCRASQRPRMG